MKRTHCIALAALALWVLVWAPNAQAQTKKISYAVAPLNPPPGTDTSSVRAINNNGQAAGYASITGTSGTRACIWERIAGQWVARDLGLAAYFSSYSAVGINDLSQITGSGTDFDGVRRAYFYNDVTGTCETLPSLNGMQSSSASAMNNLGVICGSSSSGSGSTYMSTATLWERLEDGTWTATDLAAPFESLHNRRSYATDVNDANLVVGYSYVYDGAVTDRRSHVWERVSPGVWAMQDLPGGGGDVNNFGQILGTHLVNGTSYPCIWNRVGGNWTPTDLSSFVLDLWDFGYSGINDLGHVFTTGHPLDGTGYAVPVLIKNGAVLHLNDYRPDTLLPDWYLMRGWEMNNQGQLVGTMQSNTEVRSFLMDTSAVTYSYNSTYVFPPRIKDNSTASQSMTLTDNVKITDLNVRVTLTHSQFSDLKFELIGPDNVTRLLCDVGGVTGSVTSPYNKTLVFDDEGAAGTIIPPNKVLSSYDGKSTKGKWTLKISDKVKNNKTGTFWNFTLDVMPQL